MSFFIGYLKKNYYKKPAPLSKIGITLWPKSESNMKKYLFIALAAFSFVTLSQSCKKKMKDEDIQKSAMEVVSKMSDMKNGAVSVKDGIATISGECADQGCMDKCKKAFEDAKIKGLKSIDWQCKMAPAMPVMTAADEVLTKGLAEALKAYPGITSAVKDGVVSLMGEIKKDGWMKLKQVIDKMKPKSIDPKGLTIK
jgi:hyperosmotically inducible periplasmic protein